MAKLAESASLATENISNQTIEDGTDLELPTTIAPYLILTIILSIFAIAPLFYPGFIQTHDGFVTLWNIADLRQNFGDFSWRPHIALEFNGLRSNGLLLYYLTALLPLSELNALKFVVGASWVAGGVGIFLWLRSWFGNPGALVSALVYVYLPYQIVTVYIRGAWGETLFFGILPWAILAATYLVTSPRWVLVPIAALFGLMLGLSQLGLTVWAFIFLVILLLIVHFAQALLPIISALLGLVGSFIVSFPFITSPTNPTIIFTDHFLYPFQLFSAYWGFGVSTADSNDGLSLQLGLTAIGLSVLTVLLWQRQTSSEVSVERSDRRLLFFSGTVVILSLLLLGVFAFIWQLPLLATTLTYPWQLLGLIGLCLAVLSGASLWIDRQLERLTLFAGIIIIIVLSSFSYLEPNYIQADMMTLAGPEAELGQSQLSLVSHDFAILTTGHTAGLSRGETTIPFSVRPMLTVNDILIVNVVWQPHQLFADNLKIFAHLVDVNGNMIAQFDGQPKQGEYLTSQWLPGEVIEDSYPIRFPENAPPGPYQVYLGLYEEATFARLPVAGDTEGRIILTIE